MFNFSYLRAAVVLLVLSVSGCATNSYSRPSLGYADSKQSFTDTAIVVCQTSVGTFWRAQKFGCTFANVDEINLKGSPPWVRVLPGHHAFGIEAYGYSRRGYADIGVDAQPRHVYFVSIEGNTTVFGGTFRPHVQDLGEKSFYKLSNGEEAIGVATFQQ